ncbi:MAG TPA: hypothetical protein VLM37_08575 [Fibrobacteraceae bacterium]|nr:hypothetical protein [Fibrobacteraceae bacterium]
MLKQLVCLAFCIWSFPALAGEAPDAIAQSTFAKVLPLAKATLEAPDANLTLGSGYPLWRITESSSQTFLNSGAESDLYQSPIIYLYPIENEGTPVLFLSFNKDSLGVWHSNGLGFASLAKELIEIHSAWSEEDGNEIFFAEGSVGHELYFGLENVETPNLTRLQFLEPTDLDTNGARVLKYKTLGVPTDAANYTLQLISGGDQ